MLKKDGFNIDFVGSNVYSSDTANRPSTCIVDGQNLNVPWDKNQEGHSGWTTGGVAGRLQGWVNTYKPDYVLIHLGANDLIGSPTHYFDDPYGNLGIYTFFRGNQTPATNVVYPPKDSTVKGMLKTIKDINPNARIVIAKHIPMRDFSTSQLNTIIQRVYDEEKNNYNLYLADMTVGYSATIDNYDGTHPDDSGGKKMATAWYKILKPLLAGQAVPTLPPGVSPTITPTPSRTPTPSPTIPLTLNQFYKGININGNPIIIEGRQWQGEAGVTVDGNDLAVSNVTLNPPASSEIQSMIRDFSWGNNGRPEITVNTIPNGSYGIYLYIWEDNNPQSLSFTIQNNTVATGISSGQGGTWQKIGPYPAQVTNGSISISTGTSSGDANISGVEIWTANGTTITAGPTSAITGANTPTVGPTPNPGQTISMKGLRVSGNKVINENGQQVKLIGVNIAGTEYSCVGGKDTGVMPWGIFEVPATQQTINGLKKWNINTVRVPLNESCWNGIPSVDTRTNIPSNTNEYLGKFNSYSGENYRSAITNWVNLLTQNNIAVVVEIHWSAPGTFVARDQAAMLNRDNSIRAWTDISNRFKNNSAVLFDLHNEPYSWWRDWNQESTTATWNCWKKGSGTGVNCAGLDEWWDHASNSFNNGAVLKYQAAGMDELTAAVRATGAQNIIILGGLTYANNLTHFLQYKPNDSNIMASIHNYNFNHCDNRQCWEQQYKPVAQVVPVIAGEVGQSITVDWKDNLDQEFVNKITAFYDENNIHYLAWLWNIWGKKENQWGCNSHTLVSNYDGTVNKGCKHSEDLYKAMQKTLASHNPGVPVSPSPGNPVPTSPATITQNPTTAPTNVVPTTPPECTSKTLGDANCDSRTSLVDFEYLRRGISSGNTNADFNKDGKVTIDDFTNWLTNFLF